MKALKAVKKLARIMHHAWGPVCGGPEFGVVHARDGALQSEVVDHETAGQMVSSSVLLGRQEARPALSSDVRELGGHNRASAPAYEPQPVWRPLPELTIASLLQAKRSSDHQFVAIVEVELLKPQLKRGSSLHDQDPPAECALEGTAGATRRGQGRQECDAARSRGPTFSVDAAVLAKRYCAYQVSI